tara:strand:+ start:138 stop:281 length:144 start_codon:yes stop_codon:yes gene_type:complete
VSDNLQEDHFINLIKGYEVEIARLKAVNEKLREELKSLREKIEKIEE